MLDLTDLYDQRVDSIYRYHLARTGDGEAAEDLTAETFLTASEERAAYQSEDGLPVVWLVAIARRKLANYLRRGERGRPVPPERAGHRVATGLPTREEALLRCCADFLIYANGFSRLGRSTSNRGKSRWVASVVGRGVLVWDVKSREVRYNFAIDPVDWRSVNLAFSPDGRYMATGGRNIILWSLDSGEKEEVFMGHNAVVSGLSFSPDSTRLVSGSVDGTLVVWDTSILPP